MSIDEKILNTIGLASSIIGGIIWFFSPQTTPSSDVSLGFPDSQPLPEGKGFLGRTVGEHKKQVQKINDGIVCRLKWALILIILGFAIQILAVWE